MDSLKPPDHTLEVFADPASVKNIVKGIHPIMEDAGSEKVRLI